MQTSCLRRSLVYQRIFQFLSILNYLIVSRLFQLYSVVTQATDWPAAGYSELKWIEIYMLFEAVVTDAKSKGTFLDMVANYILYLHFNESKIAWVPYSQSFYAAWRLQYALYWCTRNKLGILHKINMLLIVIFLQKYPGQQKKIMLIEIP